MRLYLLVSKDKYELPLFVADSPKELAEKVGLRAENIRSCIYHAKARGGKSRYRVVEVEDD